MVMPRVIVVPYNEVWHYEFEKIKGEIEASLGSLAVAIEHVGSTAVEGLWAKPILDIDVVISDRGALPAVIEKLEGIGYEHEGDFGIEGREAFRYDNKPGLMIHHLYVCAQDLPELRRHLALRDYLRSHPDAVREYSRVKSEGAALFLNDVDGYTNYKGEIVRRIYGICGV